MMQRSPMKPAAVAMKRSAMKPGTKGLQRSKPMSASANPLKASSSLKAGSTFKRQAPMKQGPADLSNTPWKRGAQLKRSTLGPSKEEKPSKLPPLPTHPDGESSAKVGWKQSKPMKTSRKSVPKAQKEHMGRVAAIGCILCHHLDLGTTPAIVHHLRTGQGKRRAPNWLTLPLCPPHHQHSGYGVHDMGRQQFYDRYGISEIGLLVQVFQHLRVDQSDPNFAIPPDAITAAENDEADSPDHDAAISASEITA